jgi:hypothetical protein
MIKKTALFVLAVTSLAASGCLRKETSHILYLSPDGGVRWSATELDVHSDEEDAGKRFAEEQAYIGPALLGGHPVAAGLKALGPVSLVDTTVLRDERPFHVVTQARFHRLDALVDRLLGELGIKGRTQLTTVKGRSNLVVTFDFSRDPEDKGSPVARMLEDTGHLTIVLTHGVFADSPSFDVTDRTRASISKAWWQQAEEAIEARRPIELRLSWHGDGDKP